MSDADFASIIFIGLPSVRMISSTSLRERWSWEKMTAMPLRPNRPVRPVSEHQRSHEPR
jgi:hypothetical protein